MKNDETKKQKLQEQIFRQNMDNRSFGINRWKMTKLSKAPIQIIDGDRGKNYPSQDDLQEAGYCLFLSTKNVRPTGFDFSEKQFISKERDTLLRKGKLQRYDLVLTTRGTVGNIGFYNEKVPFDNIRINSGMVIIRPLINEIDPTFNYYMFRSLQNDFHSFISGSAQPQLPIKDLNEMEITLPPLPEQRAIAAVLSSLDDKIDLLQRQNKTLEAMTETLFRQWFVEPCKNGLPEGWEEKRLGDYVDCINGVSYKGSDLNTSDCALVTLKNFDPNGGFRLDGFKCYTGKYKEEQIVCNGDLAVAHTDITQDASIIGNPIYIIDDPKYKTLVISMDLVKVNPKHSWLSKEFLYLLMKTSDFKEHCLGLSNGSTVLHLSRRAVPSYVFKMPPRVVIEEFTKIVKGIFSKMNKNIGQIRTLEKLRDLLLPKLISGEIRVKYE